MADIRARSEVAMADCLGVTDDRASVLRVDRLNRPADDNRRGNRSVAEEEPKLLLVRHRSRPVGCVGVGEHPLLLRAALLKDRGSAGAVWEAQGDGALEDGVGRLHVSGRRPAAGTRRARCSPPPPAHRDSSVPEATPGTPPTAGRVLPGPLSTPPLLDSAIRRPHGHPAPARRRPAEHCLAGQCGAASCPGVLLMGEPWSPHRGAQNRPRDCSAKCFS